MMRTCLCLTINLQMLSLPRFRSLPTSGPPPKMLHSIARKPNNAQRIARSTQMKVTFLYIYETLLTSSEHLHSTAQPTDASRTRKRSKWTEANEEPSNPMKTKTYGSLTVDIPMKKTPTSSKRSVPADDAGRDAEQPVKKVKVAKHQSAKSMPLYNSSAISKPVAEDPAVKKPLSAMKKDTKRKKERPPESDDEDHMPKKPASKKARFDEEQKPGVQISSEKQKENALPSRKPRTGKLKSKSRGPPKDVLDRIKASATLHRIDDSEPDPLDCLS
ncbi:hypothetical protein DEU56DRAFT_453619 [Suillus clintonianus]|uniref:uncharacterized protein n=1 Tax=Suillus clintonianus TaxID=1904413 RepID=UPI001B886050|nr:uncharacterized protein DEU56DRAFT_453619 [Suillus clintonianus]KAG2131656.1 hypothetical protein DEU56DRAFT_453619 [Suillus clintonianus]